ncbi:dipeptide ABC transporter ATP-binding protein [Agreia pratensis]|uniref:Peptide/nickel transport system ATP-binding protein n=1 Tax=Agreia pratensis TaxID=150121 RepID=A0A1X7IRU2_9MICO|nr:ABC transporter ATP-binding protein [Agreia pratensis]SMG17529.1 peptide/nickel transport system ATP-binding protein [Agreia pratensis]
MTVSIESTRQVLPAVAPTARSGRPDGASLLTVEGLAVAYGDTTVVRDVGFSLERGQSLALIGESGSGKSTVAKSILRLLPSGESATSGRVSLEGRELFGLPERQFRPLRGRLLGYIPQDPSSALNPVRTIGSQAHEAAALAGESDARVRRRNILSVFEQVGLPDPERVYASYPHQLSGGMLQRVLIGLTVLPRPALIVADEPTSALDVTIQKLILDLLSELRRDLGIGLLLITHDLAVAAERADSIVVLKNGVVEESGSSRQVFSAPTSEYARQLHADVPALNPDRYRVQRTAPSADAAPVTVRAVEVRDVSKRFRSGDGEVAALDGVSFTLEKGTTHALVGESGSGKTTAVRLLLGLEQPDAGQIEVAGSRVHGQTAAELRSLRRHLQLVYQNPFTSLDPTWRVSKIVREPLDRFRVDERSERARLVQQTLDEVGLPASVLSRRPSQLSGGQRQRVAIARALVVRPDVLVLDEPTSALDVSVQAGILELLSRLQREHGLSYLLVSHDLALVRQLADTVSVLKRGKVVESGTVDQIFARPEHPYTRALLEAIPRTSG